MPPRALARGGKQSSNLPQIVFEFISDAGWSDEDGDYETEYGAFGVDDVALSGSLTDGDVTSAFDGGLDGWTPQACPVFGAFMGTRDVSQ